jgi:hypothetical protein
MWHAWEKLYIYIYIYNILVRKPEGKRPLGRPRRRWEGILECILGK